MREYTARFSLAFTRMLSDARIDAGLSRDQLALMLGVKAKTIERHELGETAPSLERVEAWLTACGKRCVIHTMELSPRRGEAEPTDTMSKDTTSTRRQ